MISNLPDRIFLCGFMGAGKSTIGNRLAHMLDVPFIDLDTFIEDEEGSSIAEIFDRDGEEKFRNLERAALLKVIRDFEGVIALGGGTLQNQHLLDHVKLNGLLIFIESPFSVIFERISNHADRPLLLDDKGNMKDEEILKKDLKKLYEKRLPLYRQAVIQIDSSKFDSLEGILDTLIQKIKNHVSHY